MAAIIEIVRTSDNCVLVCAHSNAACDEIAERLVKMLTADEVYRMYAKTFDSAISENIRAISNQMQGEYKFPSLEYLHEFRVVICTILTSGCITRARGSDHKFNSSHFSHVFIDEAACVQQIVTMIPIAGT